MKRRSLELLSLPRSIGAVTAFALAWLVAPAPVFAQNAYITNLPNTVSVIDTTSNTVVATIPGFARPFGVAVTPDGSKVYVTNGGDDNPVFGVTFGDTVSVIDTATNTMVATIGVGANPFGVAVTPDGSKVYVTNRGDNPLFGGTVSVIDTATNTVVATIGVGILPRGVAVTPDGSKVYVANDNSSVSVIDTATNTEVATITFDPDPLYGVWPSPYGVAVTRDGGKLYVVSDSVGTVLVIDTATNTVTARITTGPRPSGVAVTPDGSKVYVANSASTTVSVIDTATNAVATINVGSNPVGVAVTPDGSKVYVANEGSEIVSVIDTSTDTVIGSPIPVGQLPIAFGLFIQQAPTFAGAPGSPNCHDTSVAALAQKYRGLAAAARSWGFQSVSGLQDAITAFCGG
jgi:YVTN family beta-propeller protein